MSPALQKAGFTVDVADNGEEALRRLESKQPFDLVFSDIVMPGAVSGIELAEIVRIAGKRLRTIDRKSVV